MKVCNRSHPPNVICEDRRCYWGDRNAYLRLQRRLDRAEAHLRRLRETDDKKLRRAGEA